MTDTSKETPFQQRVWPWLLACFGEKIAGDREERNHRFLEEALELVQATGCTRSEAHQLVDYVFDRPIGEPHQEVGGVQVTLAALCLANALDMHKAGEDELARIWTKVDAIRAKQAAKPKRSPLPQHVDRAVNAHDDLVAALEKCAAIIVAANYIDVPNPLSEKTTYNIRGHGLCSVGSALDEASFALDLAKARGD